MPISRPTLPAKRHRGLLYLATGAAALLIMGWAVIAMLAHRSQPYIKDRLVRYLETRFDATAELGALQVSGFLRIHIVGENLTLRRDRGSGRALSIAVPRFEFQTSPLHIPWLPLNIGTVQVSGMSITLPPRDASPTQRTKAAASVNRPAFVAVEIECDNTHLELLTDKPGKLPLVFDIQSLSLKSAAAGRAMPFTAKLTNPKPIGDIDAKGEFGPWQTEEPRDTPVSGNYSFTHADLSTIHGIGGILSSQGSFQGKLDRIEVQGKTDTPDFTVSTGQHPVPLHTEFSATVDGATGDTYLHPVRATLLHSSMVANGSVVREKGGHRITLDVVSNDARIEDLLRVAVKMNPPLFSGPVGLKTRLLLPPGTRAVPERLNLDGEFNLPAAQLSNSDAEEKLDQLSLRAQGRPKAAQAEARQDADGKTPAEVLSELRGKFKLTDGEISMSELNFKVPGASLTLAGDYHLEGEEFEFEGTARLEAKPSQTTTGVKSFFLKALDPFVAGHNAGTVLPIRISGSGTRPKVGLDLGHHVHASR